MKISKLEVKTSSSEFENGVVAWRLCSQSKCAMLKGKYIELG